MRSIRRSGGQRPCTPKKVILDPIRYPLLDLGPLGSLQKFVGFLVFVFVGFFVFVFVGFFGIS